VGAALLVTLIVYAPLLTGRIPFPADLVFDFPPFAKAAPGPSVPHADIGDLVTSFYPYRTLASRALPEGALPLWNPYMLSGAPFLANSQSALFYPGNFLYYVLPVAAAWSIGFVLRPVLAVFFTALFLRKIGGTLTGAIVSGLLFAFCGFLMAFQGQAMSDSAIWLPLIGYSVVRLRSDLSNRSIALAAFALAMPVLAGHPETAAHLALTGMALGAFLLPVKPMQPFVTRFVVAGVLALGLASVQIIPTVEWLQYIHHPFKGVWPPRPLWTVLTVVSRDIIRARNTIGLSMPEQAGYLGMMTFVAAPLALLHASRKFAIFFILWSAAALSVAFGIGPAYWVVQHTPVLSFLKNARLILVGSFGLSVLTGLGISALEGFHVLQSRDRRVWAAVLAACGFAIAFTMIFVVHELQKDMIEYVRYPRFGLYLLAASAFAIALRLVRKIRLLHFQILVMLIVALDVATVSYGAIPFARSRDIFPPVEFFDRLPKPSTTPFRIAQLGYAFGANFELIYGQLAVGGYEVSLERIKTFLKDVSRDEMDSAMLTANGVLETRDRRIDMLNAKYIVVSEWDPRYLDFRKQPDRFRLMYTAGDTDVLENLRALPPAFLVPASGIEVVPDDAQQLNRIKDPSFDPERSVVLPGEPDEPASLDSGDSSISDKKVEWVSRRSSDFELDVAAREPSILVVSQIDYPGWKSYVDGRSVPITRANYAFPAIFVAPGSHRIRFSFQPASFIVGLLLSVGALLLCAWAVVDRRYSETSERESRIRLDVE